MNQSSQKTFNTPLPYNAHASNQKNNVKTVDETNLLELWPIEKTRKKNKQRQFHTPDHVE